MTEDTHQLWDLLIKVTGVLSLILSGSVGVCQYRDAKEREFYAEFWNKRLATYETVSRVAAAISMAESLEDCSESRREFWELYFGPISLIEDESVKDAMVEFAELLEQAEEEEIELSELQEPAYTLTLALRDSLRSTWDRPFEFSRAQTE
jgi:hypothetical protein